MSAAGRTSAARRAASALMEHGGEPIGASSFADTAEFYRADAALKLDPRHVAARENYRSLVRELERIGAHMPLKNKAHHP